MFLDLVGAENAKRFRKGVLPFMDCFAGAGGTALGAIIAMARLRLNTQLACVNHWQRAVDTHSLNFGHEHLHFCTGVDRIDLEDLLSEVGSRGFFALWGSPSCVNHSRARGSVPINEQDRGGCNMLLRYIRKHEPIFVWVENVVEFLDYGPLRQKRDRQGNLLFLKKNPEGQWKQCLHPEGVRPKGISTRRWWKQSESQFGLKPAMEAIPEKRGLYYREWAQKVRRSGYLLDWRVINAADFGAPTNRKRLIVQAVRKDSGKKIVWPNPTHSMNGEGGLLPALVTRDCLDMSDLGESIFTRPRPLADKTIKRIAVGLIKFGFAEAVIKFKGTGTAISADKPLDTVQAGGNHYGIIHPSVSVLIPQHRGRPDELRVKGVDNPHPTITTTGADAVAHAVLLNPSTCSFIAPNFGERPTQTPRTHSIDQPMPAVTSHGAGMLVSGMLEPFTVETNHGNGREGDNGNERRAKGIKQPFGTVTASRGHALVSPVPVAGDTSEVPVVVNDWRDLAEVLKAAVKRAKSEPAYRPLISYQGVVARIDVLFRMMFWRELARAQSFPDSYQFLGTQTEIIRQIGNAVAPAVSYAVCMAAVSQNPNIEPYTCSFAPEVLRKAS